MTISTACPHCGAAFPDIPDGHAGKTARCSKCNGRFRIEPAPASPDGAVAWQVGDVIANRYEVRALLGEGGMGTVHLVHHRDWHIDLAVKSPRPGILSRAGGAENFEREAETWVGLGLHPHTVSCYYVRRLGGIPRVFAEFVPGGSLSDWIRTGKLYAGSRATALERMLDIAVQFAWGLHYSHETSLIHQDVKPANVMMTPDGIAKVTDFGLARARPMAGGPGTDGAGTVVVDKVGMTPAYASPEQASGGSLTRRTDLWSWGVSILEMFTGEVTWPSGTVVAGALDAYLASGPEREGIPPMPEGLAALLRRCFQEDPDGRPHDMAGVAEDLFAVYRETTGKDYPRQQPRAGRDLPDSLNNRAVSLLDLGKRKEAEKLWESALGIDPRHLEAAFNRTVYEWKYHGIPREEIDRRMEEIGRAHGDDRRYHHLRGRVHLYFGEYEKAVDALGTAAEGGSDADVLRDLGLALCAREKDGDDPEPWRAAAAAFDRAAEAGHEDPALVAGRALCLKRLGRKKAADDFARTARRRTDLPRSLEAAVQRFLPGHETTADVHLREPVSGLAMDPDGGRIVSAGPAGFHAWEIREGRLSASPDTRHQVPDLRCAAFGPRARQAVLAGSGPNLFLLDVETGRTIRKIGPCTGTVQALAVGPDGSAALSAGSDRTLRLWDLASGENTRTFEGHPVYTCAAAFHPKAPYVLSGSGDGSLRIWDIRSGKCLRTLEGHTAPVTAAAFSPAAPHVVSSSGDGTIRLWDIRSGKSLRVFSGHSGPVTCVCFSPDGRSLVSGGRDGSLRTWDIRSGTLESLVRFPVPIRTVVAARRGTRVAVSLAGDRKDTGRLALLDDAFRERYRIPYRVCTPLTASEADLLEQDFRGKLAEAERCATAGDYRRAFELIDTARAVPGFEYADDALALRRILAARFPNGKLRDIREFRSFTGHEGPVQALAVFSSGDRALSAGRDNTLRLWDLKTGRCIHTLEGHEAPLTCAAVDEEGTVAVSGSTDRTLRVWHPGKGACVKTLRGYSDYITATAVTPDGGHALCACRDGSFRLLGLPDGASLRELKGHASHVTAVAVSPDGMYAVSGAMDRTLRLWDLASGRCLQVLEGHGDYVTAVAVSPDGMYAVSGDNGGTVRRWGLRTGDLLRTFTGHTGPVVSVDIGPDGMTAVSGGRDRTLRVWDLKTGQCRHAVEGHADEITAAVYGPDGQFLLSAGMDETVRMWHMDWEPRIREFVRWDEAARPHLERFLIRHTPRSGEDVVREGRPEWNDGDFEALCRELSHRGCGWIEPDGVKERLEQMARQWQGPPPAEKRYAVKQPEKAWYDNRILLFPVKHWKYAAAAVAVLLLYLIVSSLFHGTGGPGVPDGFRDAKFRMSLIEFPDMAPLEQQPRDRHMKACHRPGDELSFQGVPLSAIHYLFYDGRLMEIRIYPADPGGLNRLWKYYRRRFGRGRQFVDEQTGKITRFWQWRKSGFKRGIRLAVEFDPEEERGGSIFYTSAPRPPSTGFPGRRMRR